MNDFKQYTKAQKACLYQIGGLFNKTYTETALIGEINKIFKNDWIPYRIADGIAVKTKCHDLNYTLRFETVKGVKSTYRLLEFFSN